MRLLMTTDTIGGVWTFNKELAGGLLSRGCEILLISHGREPSSEQQREADELTGQGHFRYVVTGIPLEWMPHNERAYLAAEPMLLQLCRDFKPDALLLSQFCFGALPVAAPKIVIAHSDVLSWAEATGKAPLAEDAWLLTYRILVQAGLDGADALMVPTQAAFDSMSLHYRLPSKTAVIPNGRRLASRTQGEARRLRAITAGRMWDPAKNLVLLRDVEFPFPMLIAGENGEDTVEDHQTTFLGYRSESELLTLFRQSAIYICCSAYEPFGLAPLEAALCGCAIVAFGIPSLREVWGDAALYFTGAHGLGVLLRELAQDPWRLAEAQRRSNAHAQTYSTARMADGYLQQIACVVEAKAGEQACAA